ncbi:GMC family oxidoreductase N-terminal domain-containing protein [Acidisoma cellulosilytica]|uniref:GMC family oxidoreductase N-terminal domain-containing protein n=1 Tax=Acidisoma cellulosilyticum TaxID=2802395 RepID=A0A963Z6Z1_9PROT|nr:GMC family oxidoreductase N-terminal domain-containing protein [Acidisoma cellulosilyticum]MCB8883716.1 GMC family oxidoreductase N-terminal domain-containing protein [Acidisoma cellulosilyticum]
MYDTIILGAGSAGCVLANRLSSDPDRKVLVLEAGREAPINSRVPSDWVSMFNTAVDWGYHTTPQAGCRGRRVFWPRGKMIGGSGAMNAMIYIRGLPSDFDGWEALGCPGWGWKDVLPTFMACESNADFTKSPFHGTEGPLHVEHPNAVHPYEQLWIDAGIGAGYPANADFNGASQEGFGTLQFTIRGGERSGTGRAYLQPALDRPNLTVTPGVLVTRLIIENGRAVGVEYLENGQQKRAFASEQVVLAAGAIGSPQLLMLSGIGAADELSRQGIGPVVDLPQVGRNLQDHINIIIGYHTREPVGVGTWTAEFLDASLKQWEEERSGDRSLAWCAAAAHISSKPEIDPDLQLYGLVSPHRDAGRFLSSRSGMTFCTVLQRPDARGEITLRSADPIEQPDINPRYFESGTYGADLTTMVEGIRIQRRIARTAPLADVLDGEMSPGAECQTHEEIADFIRGHCQTIYHASGTCRMGKDDRAVVDPTTFKVKGVEGLHVVDASVFPTVPSGNINATVIMVAERAARAILGGGLS